MPLVLPGPKNSCAFFRLLSCLLVGQSKTVATSKLLTCRPGNWKASLLFWDLRRVGGAEAHTEKMYVRGTSKGRWLCEKLGLKAEM